MLLFIWLNIHSCVLVGVDVCSMGTIWGELFWGSCVVELYGGSCGELCSAIVWGAVLGGAVWGRCVGDHVESCVGSSGRSWGELWEGGHAHQSLDSPGIASSTSSTRGIPHYPLSNCPYPVPAHSSSQVVHCRVCPPHPLHAPVLVLHLAVYPASPTQGRVGLTDRLTHSAQTQCNVSR